MHLKTQKNANQESTVFEREVKGVLLNLGLAYQVKMMNILSSL